MSKPPSAAQLAASLASGSISAREVVDACLARIEAREGEVQAFAHLSPEHARAQADALDKHRKSGRRLGPLHGLPVAVKDIIDTADQPTENGTPQDAGRCPRRDATLVARLRAAGAVIIGKTVTTELATMKPGPTRHPRDPSRSPGGSSSGSAAAVADGMVPLAIGTQTAGSVIRPAAFCGIVGYKPTHGAIPLTGVLQHSQYLDTIGTYATNLEDAALLAEALMGHDPQDTRTRLEAVPALTAAAREGPSVPPRYAVVRTHAWPAAAPETADFLDEVRQALGEAADEVELPDVFENALPSHRRIMDVGMARSLGRYADRGPVGEKLAKRIADGRRLSALDYLTALDWRRVLGDGLDEVFGRYDAIVTPAAPGEATPQERTGDAIFNATWSLLGTPALTLPVGTGPTGFPLGLQVVGRWGEDARLMRSANALWRALGGAGTA